MNSANGSSLTELMIVLAIVGILSAVAVNTLYPAMQCMLYGC